MRDLEKNSIFFLLNDKSKFKSVMNQSKKVQKHKTKNNINEKYNRFLRDNVIDILY